MVNQCCIIVLAALCLRPTYSDSHVIDCEACWASGPAQSEECCWHCPTQCPWKQCLHVHSSGYECYDPKTQIVCDLGIGEILCNASNVCPSAGSTCSGGAFPAGGCSACPAGTQPDAHHCACVASPVLDNSTAVKYAHVGNEPCPKNMTPLTSSLEECAKAAETLWPGGGCYGQSWSAIVETPQEPQTYVTGCMQEDAAGGGCALLFAPTGKASVCPEETTCDVICIEPPSIRWALATPTAPPAAEAAATEVAVNVMI